MEILQLPILALQERIDKEMLDNPTLESVDSFDSTDSYDSTNEYDSYNSSDYSEQEKPMDLDRSGEEVKEERLEKTVEEGRISDTTTESVSMDNTTEEGTDVSLDVSKSSDDSSNDKRDVLDASELAQSSEHEYEERDLGEQELVIHENGGQDDFERLNNLGEEYSTDFSSDSSDYASDYYSGSGERRTGRNSEEESELYNNMLANMMAKPETLQDHLIQQLSWFELSVDERQACEKIIYNLDERGYFVSSLDDLFPGSSLEMEQMQSHALEIVQSLEPRGVGARDIRECLLLQLNPDQKFYPELKNLLENYLTDLEYNRLPLISKATGYSIDFLQTLIQEFKALNPSPGREYQYSVVPLLVPDVYVTPNSEGGYNVSLEDQEIPRLKISSFYRKLESSKKATPEEKEYIHRKLNSAQWLIDSIAQRNNTILRVCQAIVDYQKEFLNNGPEFLKPLKMQQIADSLGIHVATVSRAVDEKWAQTPRGVFPLRSFFGGGAPASSSQQGEEESGGIAWTVIQGKIKEMVDNEDKSCPLSDDTIMERLSADGIVVARRTIAKYRKILNIPSSRQRRDWSLPLKKEA